MLTEQINGFIEYCKVSGFSDRSIQALTIRLNDFNEFLKFNRFFHIQNITYRHLSAFVADYKNPSIHVKKSRIWSLKPFFHHLKLNAIAGVNTALDLPYPKIENRSVCLSFFNSGFFCQLCRSEPVVFSWDSKVSKLLKMVFPTISDILFRLRPTM